MSANRCVLGAALVGHRQTRGVHVSGLDAPNAGSGPALPSMLPASS